MTSQVSVSAFIHAVVCYITPPTTALASFRGPSAPPPQGLLARVYAVKNVYTAMIRLYAAYDPTNTAIYDLTILTFIGVLGLYGSERFVFRTVAHRESMFPFVTAGTGLIWMVMQRGHYVS
jgi:hypothetical protein